MNPSLVLVSHGTADACGQEVITRLAAAVRFAAAPFEVHEAVVDVEEHRLSGVLASLRRPAVVVPLLLSSGFHVRHDVAEAVAAHPSAVATAALGPEPALAEVAVQRLWAAGAAPDDEVVMVASGSSDARALADVDRAFELLRERWDGPVRLGHLGSYGTPAAQVVAQARATGRRVVASSYLLAPGHFQGLLERLPVDVATAPLLSPSPERVLVDLVMRRFEAAARNLDWAPFPAHPSQRSGT